MEALAPVFNMIQPDCSNFESLPDLIFKLGGETFKIPASIYVIKMTGFVPKEQGIIESLFGPPQLEKVTECMPAFLEMNMNVREWGPMWILGMPFMRYYYTVFQRDPKSIHIAYATHDCKPVGSEPPIYFGNMTKHSVFTNSS